MDIGKTYKIFLHKFLSKVEKFIPLPLKIHHNKTLVRGFN